MKLLRAALAALLFAVPAAARAQSAVLQGGPWTQGHPLMYSSPSSFGEPVVQDPGPAGGGLAGQGLSEILQTNQGTGSAPYAGTGTGPLGTHDCHYDGPITGPYHYLCFDANANGGGLILYGAAGGASAIPLYLNINGSQIPIQIGLGGGNVTGPVSSAVGHLATWGNTIGTSLVDSPISSSALAALALPLYATTPATGALLTGHDIGGTGVSAALALPLYATTPATGALLTGHDIGGTGVSAALLNSAGANGGFAINGGTNAGNTTWTGTQTVNAPFSSWTSSSYAAGLLVNINGAFPASALFAYGYGGNYDALTGQVDISASSTLLQAAGVSGYARYNGGAGNAVGVYSAGLAKANAASPSYGVWGGNDLASNSPTAQPVTGTGYSISTIGREIDVNCMKLSGGAGPNANCIGLWITGASETAPQAGNQFDAINIGYAGAYTNFPWQNGILFNAGSVNYAITRLAAAPGNSQPSIPDAYISTSGSGTSLISTFGSDASGNLVATPEASFKVVGNVFSTAGYILYYSGGFNLGSQGFSEYYNATTMVLANYSGGGFSFQGSGGGVLATIDASGNYIAGGSITSPGKLTALSSTAPPAGGAQSSCINASSTANFGICWGSGAPTLSMAQGSLYMRTDGTAGNRLYVNNNGTTGWTAY